MNKELFGLNFYSNSFNNAVEELTHWVKTGNEFRIAVTANVDHLTKLNSKYSNFKSTYSQAYWCFPDGSPIVLASRLLGKSLTERITGADLLVSLLGVASKEGLKVGFLVANKTVAQKLTEYCREVGIASFVIVTAPNPMDVDEIGLDIAKEFALSGVDLDIVFAGVSFPKQEQWLFKYGDLTGAKLGMGIGAGLEFLLKMKKRCPEWLQRLHLEWLYRAITDTRLIPRYLSNFSFFYLLIEELLQNFTTHYRLQTLKDE